MSSMTKVQRRSVLGLLCALSLYYAFVTTAGKFHALDWTSNFYDRLAEGFRAGHLYIREAPKPELLARAHPLDYTSWDDWDAWLWDASLYDSHYYVYWGPVPALLLLGVKLILGTSVEVGDQWIVLFFSLMRLYAGAALIVGYARTQYPELPRWALQLAIVVFAVASPTPYVLARPLIYEASVASGQGFLCLGLYCAYRGLCSPLARTRWLVAAGSCLGCALGSRASLIISAPLIVLATAACARRHALGALFAIGTPVAAALVLYALYNYARFDSFSEFGLSYQLTGRRVSSEGRHFLPNLFSYAGAELSWSCKFPFVRLPSERHLSTLIVWPSDYDTGAGENGERVGGLLVATVFCWLWCIWPARALFGLKRTSRRELWLMLCALALIASFAPASRMYLASMRYLEDAAAGVLLGAIAAGFWLLRPSQARDREAGRARRWLAPTLYAGLALHSIFVGAALGFTGYADSFRKENKALFAQLERKLSVCGVKQRLLRWTDHALQPSESAPFYVAWRDVIHFSSRGAGSQGPTARP
jgi:hypothetical protein